MIWKSDLPFYCNTFWLVAWTVGGVWLSAELDTESMLGWYLQVEGWGCCFVQSENPCFGTCTKLGIINKNLCNVGLCLVPVTGHKPFSSTSPFKLAQKLLCACAGRGTSRLRAFFDTFPAVIWMWALTSPISSRWRLQATAPLLIQGRWLAEVTAQGLGWVCRDRTEPRRWGRVVKGWLAAQLQQMNLKKKYACLDLSLPAHRSLF